mmetsp:Transcript_56223/g.133983  ORF Transcript_56223/g.133983 Transcript_56223/m.133983 type:complete len:273 (+) Transcript_56223:186-1004(+)
MRDATNLLRVFQVLTHGIDCEARGGVEHGLVVSCLLPAHVAWANLQFVLSAAPIILQDVHRHACGSGILLEAGIDGGVLAHFNGLGEEVGRHVCHQRDCTNIRSALKLDTIHSLVGTVVHVCSLRVQLPILFARDGRELCRFSIASHGWGAVLHALFVGLLTPLPCNEIVRLRALAEHVHWDCCKLQGCPTLSENDLVLGWNIQDVTQVLLGLVGDGDELLGAVGHLHHTHARSLVVQHLALDCLKHLYWHGGWASREVVDASLCHGDDLCG